MNTETKKIDDKIVLCPVCKSGLILTEFKYYNYYKCPNCSVKITEPKDEVK